MFFRFIILYFIFSSFFITAQDFWQPLNGPSGGTFSTALTDTNGYIFGWQSSSSQMFRTLNNGDSWEQIGLDLPTGISGKLLTVNEDSNHIYFKGNSSFYKSSDLGISWQRVFHSLDTLHVRTLVFGDSNYIFAGLYNDGVYRTSDYGISWQPVNNGILYPSWPTFTVRQLLVDKNGWIYAVSDYRGVNRTKDNGQNWAHLGLFDKDVRHIAKNDSGNIFAACSRNKMYRSNKNGFGWTAVNNGLTINNSQEVLITKHGDIFTCGTWPGIYYSNDNGDSWINIDIGMMYPYVKFIIEDKNENIFAVGQESVYKLSNNDSTWLNVTNGLGNSKISSFNIDNSRNLIVGTPTTGIFLSADLGTNWQNINYNLKNYNFSNIYITSNNYFFANSGDQILRTMDSGLSWDTLNLATKLLHIDKHDNIYAGAYGNIHKSEDNGETWYSIMDTILWDRTNALTTSDSGHIYVAVHENYYYSPPPFGTADGAIYRLKNGRRTWDRLYYLPPPGPTYIIGLDDIIVNNLNYIYFTNDHSDLILRSINNGNTWTSIRNGIIAYKVNTLNINYDGVLFAGTVAEGAYMSYDYGDSWIQINSGLSNLNIQSFKFDAYGYIYSKSGNKLYRSTNSIFTSLSGKNEIKPEKFHLHQNYPNPFNNTTKIKFDIPNKSFVIMNLYNINGKKIKTIFSRHLNAGQHQIIFHNKDLASGIYFFEIIADNLRSVKKMILIK